MPKKQPTRQKHLRLRGENAAPTLVERTKPETPPLTRRKPTLRSLKVVSLGNTSAYAEKTPSTPQQSLKAWKHLRLRGENPKSTAKTSRTAETPPLTRRKRSITCMGTIDGGNTSAYAEKTNFTMEHLTRTEKHLRLRGENHLVMSLVANAEETPPLTRRKPRQEIVGYMLNRNTSAYAEKTPVPVTRHP